MKKTDVTYLQDISQRMFPHVVRSAWRRRFAQDAHADRLQTRVNEDRLWVELEQRLDFAEARSRLGASRALVTALAAAAAVALVVWSFPQESSYDGLKSGSATSTFAELRALKFAIVGPDGQMTPGERNMQISVGTPIVFSLEALGVNAADPLRVALDYNRLPFAESHAIARIEVTDSHAMVRGEHGYVAFTPHEPGAYVIVARNLSAEREIKNEHSISLRVVAP